ncbi:hypothetical protein SKAU_G00339100 [Synaphobranchus kaupii]|uniref:Uncharacterized protein n=1 Tax=Synaphobranchus kaupii TaxID=118154 RepID=A0A9Q1EMQ8_SYNKA|nr:hypothetical protein SKAU_G00339100 [Synaphobranchus kaupii]
MSRACGLWLAKQWVPMNPHWEYIHDVLYTTAHVGAPPTEDSVNLLAHSGSELKERGSVAVVHERQGICPSEPRPACAPVCNSASRFADCLWNHVVAAPGKGACSLPVREEFRADAAAFGCLMSWA